MPVDKFGKMVPSEAQDFSWDDIPDTDDGDDFVSIKRNAIADLDEQTKAYREKAAPIPDQPIVDPQEKLVAAYKKEIRETQERSNMERFEKNKRALIDLLEKNNIHPQNIADILSSGRVSDAIKKYPEMYTKKALNEAADDIRVDLEKMGIEIDEQGKVRNLLAPELRNNEDVLRDVVTLHACAKILGRITPSPERQPGRTIADDLYEHCNRLGLSGVSVEAALDHDLLKTLTDDGYRGTEDKILFDAINKTIRSVENEHKFIINEEGEPEFLGLLDRLNIFTRNKKLAAIKKSPAFNRIRGLMTLARELKIAPILKSKPEPKPTPTLADRFANLTPKTTLGKAAFAAGTAAVVSIGTYEGVQNLRNKKIASPDTAFQTASETTSRASENTARRDDSYDFEFLNKASRRAEEQVQTSVRTVRANDEGTRVGARNSIDNYIPAAPPKSVVRKAAEPEPVLTQGTRQAAEEESRAEKRGPEQFSPSYPQDSELANQNSALDNKQKKTILDAAAGAESNNDLPDALEKKTTLPPAEEVAATKPAPRAKKVENKKTKVGPKADFDKMESALRDAKDKILGTKTLTSAEKREISQGLGSIAGTVENLTGKKIDRAPIEAAFGEKKVNRMPPTIQEKVTKLIQSGTPADLQTAQKLLTKGLKNPKFQNNHYRAMQKSLDQVDALIKKGAEMMDRMEQGNAGPQAVK